MISRNEWALISPAASQAKDSGVCQLAAVALAAMANVHTPQDAVKRSLVSSVSLTATRSGRSISPGRCDAAVSHGAPRLRTPAA